MRTEEVVDFTKMRMGSRPFGRGKITKCRKCGRRGEQSTLPGGYGMPDMLKWNHLATVFVIPGMGAGLSIKDWCASRAEGPLPNRALRNALRAGK